MFCSVFRSKKCKFFLISFVVIFLGMWSISEIILARRWEYQKGMQPYEPYPCISSADPSDCYLKKTILKRRLEEANEKKIILIWSTRFGHRDPISVDRRNCGNCEITYNKSMVNDKRTGALLFHFQTFKANDVPKPRNSEQLHIFWCKESSASLKVVRDQNLQIEDSYMFNATLTHRTDSDFWAPYRPPFLAETVMGKTESELREVLQKKTKLAMAIVSDCTQTPGAFARMKLLKKLQAEGLDFDGYGACFEKHITFKDLRNSISSYKFFISFENSYHCKDYITEKFFARALENRVVPIAWGAKKEDYDVVAPKGSYIFVEDFKSMKDLVDYIKYLDNNDAEYMKYMRWMTLQPEEMPMYKRSHEFCSVCRALHGINIDDMYRPDYNPQNASRRLFTDGIAKRTVPSLINWFYTVDNKECFGQRSDLIQFT